MLRPVLSFSLTILFCATVLAENQSPAPSTSPSASAPPSSTDPLSALADADLQQALDFIEKKYVAPASLDPVELKRATLAGLIERLGRGVTLLPARAPEASSSPAPLYREILGGHIGYLRPGGFRKNDLSEMDGALRAFAGKNVDALILDLRAAGESEDYAMAAEFAKRFARKGETLFALRGPSGRTRVFASDRAPAYVGFVTVLIDEEMIGASEVLASVLRARDKAILIGQPTAGGTVGYDDLPLPGGMILRVAVDEAILENERIGFPRGVQPDLPVAMSLASKREIFQASLTKGMEPFVYESERPHLNEAALLAGTNPEIEAAQSDRQRRARGEQASPHDAVTQRAVDVITSIGVYEKTPGHQP